MFTVEILCVLKKSFKTVPLQMKKFHLFGIVLLKKLKVMIKKLPVFKSKMLRLVKLMKKLRMVYLFMLV